MWKNNRHFINKEAKESSAPVKAIEALDLNREKRKLAENVKLYTAEDTSRRGKGFWLFLFHSPPNIFTGRLHWHVLKWTSSISALWNNNYMA